VIAEVIILVLDVAELAQIVVLTVSAFKQVAYDWFLSAVVTGNSFVSHG